MSFSKMVSEFESVEARSIAEAFVAEAAGRNDDDALIDFVDERVSNSAFIAAAKVRDEAYRNLEILDDEIKIAKGTIPNADGVKCVSLVDVRNATRAYRELFEEVAVINTYLNNYRAVTAEAIMLATEIREAREKASGDFLTYEADTIGDLVAGGEFESGSAEWHEQRLGGIGGSDVSKILKTDLKYGAANYREILLTKVGLDVNEDDSMRDDFETAVGRGNAWEEAIRHMYADRNPHLNVAFCKTSWEGVGERSYVRANFDGLELDENGVPYGILEIKTGVHSDMWGSTDDGFDGMPAHYRQQAIWYAGNAGLSKVTLVAVLDDWDYREYSFMMDDPRAVAEWEMMDSATRDFWNLVEMRRAELAASVDNVSSVRRAGFPKSVNMKRSAELLSAYSGDDFDTAYEIVKDEFASLNMPASQRTQEDIQRALTAAYARTNPALRNKPFIGLDIETNHASPKRGRIIETGIVSLKTNGETEILLSELHGLDDHVAYGVGVGSTEIHRIDLDMLVGKKVFEDAENQKKILEILKSGVLVAHNASFEKEFLIVNLDGFAEAFENGEIQILDTRQITSHLMLDSDNNSLNSFSEDNGIPYVGAHAATIDAMMMMKALNVFMNSLYNNGVFVATPVTEEARATAEKEATIANMDR